jgi:hypothetical protein
VGGQQTTEAVGGDGSFWFRILRTGFFCFGHSTKCGDFVISGRAKLKLKHIKTLELNCRK